MRHAAGSVLILALSFIVLATQLIMTAWRQTSYFCDTVAAHAQAEGLMNQLDHVHDEMIECVTHNKVPVQGEQFEYETQETPQGVVVITKRRENGRCMHVLMSLMKKIERHKGRYAWLVSHRTFRTTS